MTTKSTRLSVSGAMAGVLVYLYNDGEARMPLESCLTAYTMRSIRALQKRGLVEQYRDLRYPAMLCWGLTDAGTQEAAECAERQRQTLATLTSGGA